MSEVPRVEAEILTRGGRRTMMTYIYLRATSVVRTVALEDRYSRIVNIDYDEAGQPVGVEIIE